MRLTPSRSALALATALTLAAIALPGSASAQDFCFGAAGMQCGGITSQQPELRAAFCIPPKTDVTTSGVCGIHSGSFLHDECCARNPNGYMCGGNDSTPNRCVAEWDRAVNRTRTGRMWTRSLNYMIANNTGTVVHAQYCGRRNARIRDNDSRFCCSRSSRPAGVAERFAFGKVSYCN